jgi:hypothetical protein
LKKPAGSVRFRFYKPKTKKTGPDREKTSRTEPNRTRTKKNRAKPEKTKPIWFEPVFVLKNRTETGWFETVSVRF